MAWGWRSAPRPDASTRSRPIWCICSRRRSLPFMPPGHACPDLRRQNADPAIPGFPVPGLAEARRARFMSRRARPGFAAGVVQPGVLGLVRSEAFPPGRYTRCLRAPTTVCDRSLGRPRWQGPGQSSCRIRTFPPRPDMPGSRQPDGGCLRLFRAGRRAARARGSSNPARFPALPHRSPLKAVRG